MATAPSEVRIRVAPPAGGEARHPTRRKPTDAEAAALSHYPATQRRELLRRLRAGELWIAPDGLLHEVQVRRRDHLRREAHAAAARDEAKRRARHTAARARSRNRR